MLDVDHRESVAGPVRTLTYGYDPHGRQNQITDGRDGTTTWVYDVADQVQSVTTPAPLTGETPLTTTFVYDNMGRQKQTILP